MLLLRIAMLLIALCALSTGAADQLSTQIEVGGALQHKMVRIEMRALD